MPGCATFAWVCVRVRTSEYCMQVRVCSKCVWCVVSARALVLSKITCVLLGSVCGKKW